jgi:hypothetical protein
VFVFIPVFIHRILIIVSFFDKRADAAYDKSMHFLLSHAHIAQRHAMVGPVRYVEKNVGVCEGLGVMFK